MRRGFTLVELLVAMAVSVLVLVMLVSVISQALRVSQFSSNSMTAYSAAAAAADLIASDLASLAVTRQPYEYLQALPEASITPNAACPASVFGTGAAGVTQPMRLIVELISPQDSAQASPTASPSPTVYPDSGQVRAVCYRIAWQDPLAPSGTTSNSTNAVFGLYRQVVSSYNSFNYVVGTTDLFQALYPNPIPNWSNPNGPSATPPVTPPAASEFVAANIIDLQVAFYANKISTGQSAEGPVGTLDQPGVIVNVTPAPGSTTPTGAAPYEKIQLWGTQTSLNTTTPTSTPPAALTGYGSVDYAEVSLTVLEDEGAKLWGNGSVTSGPNTPAALRLKYGHTLTRKVTLRTPE
jgi:prepilin-type N-terminal cleavage/methylation domain-containing protein